jgi:hypothetical protein
MNFILKTKTFAYPLKLFSRPEFVVSEIYDEKTKIYNLDKENKPFLKPITLEFKTIEQRDSYLNEISDEIELMAIYSDFDDSKKEKWILNGVCLTGKKDLFVTLSAKSVSYEL